MEQQAAATPEQLETPVSRRTVLRGAGGLMAGAIVAPAVSQGSAQAVAPPHTARRNPGGSTTVTVRLTEGTNMAGAASPDGSTIVLAIQGGLWKLPITGGAASRLTGPEIEATSPGWSPDGDQIVFQNFTESYYQVYTIGADGSGLRQVTSGHFDHREPTFSPEGDHIAFSSDRSQNGSYDIWTVDVEGDQYQRITSSDSDEHSPAWSPDGARIAYADGRFVYAVNSSGGTAEEIASISRGSVRVPAWTPDGQGVVYQNNARQWVVGGQVVTSGEDIFPFPVSWLPDGHFLYTADGHLRVRDADGSGPEDIPFSVDLELERLVTHRKDHGYHSRAPRPVQGIFSPVLSPDGTHVAFVALNNLWVMEIGKKPVQLTNDTFVEWVPSWSPDGTAIYFSSDRHGGGRPDMYRIDLATRDITRVSETPSSRMIFPTLSPDGRSFAYIDGANQSLRVHDIASGQSRLVANQAYRSNVGKPTWSPDGQTIALADVQRANTRFREGRNLIRTVDVETGEWTFHEPAPLPDQLSERFEAGPAWSPDGAWMAFIMNSTLHVIPVNSVGQPTGPARQLTEHAADMPSWGGDSRTILYVSAGRLKSIQVDGTGERDIPVDLRWRPAIANGVTFIHAGGLWDGITPTIQRNVEIRIANNVITGIRPIDPGARADALAGRGKYSDARFIDASDLTVLPGLWDVHVHPRVQDFTGQWWAVQLAYGVTSVLSNGVSTYHSVLAQESLAAGELVGPRLLTAPIYDGQRPYYGHHRNIKNTDVLALELAKARALNMDYLKAYVRAPVSYMQAIASAAQEMGVPCGSHFLSPGIQNGLGGTTHLSATQRMGYSWTESAGDASYQDVIALYSQTDFDLCTHHSQTNNVLGDDPGILDDPRFLRLMPANYVNSIRNQASDPPTESQRENIRNNVATPSTIMEEGGLVAIGTDSPLGWPALGLHARLRALAYGVSNHEALQAVTIKSAAYSHADHELGSVEPRKIADLVLVRGNPLEDVTNAANVELVMKNGVAYSIDQILEPY